MSSAREIRRAELHRHRQVGLVETRLPFDRAEADRAERPPARDERRDEAGGVRDPPDRPCVLGVVGHRLGLGLQVREQLRLAGSQGDLDRVRRDRRRVLPAQLADELGFLGIRVDGDDPVELVVLVEEVDHEVAGERGTASSAIAASVRSQSRLATSSSFARARKRGSPRRGCGA